MLKFNLFNDIHYKLIVNRQFYIEIVNVKPRVLTHFTKFLYF